MADQNNNQQGIARNDTGLSPLRMEGRPALNTVQRRGGVVASCKAFFARIFSRGGRQTLSNMPVGTKAQAAPDSNGVIAAPTRTNKPNWFKKLVSGNPNKRRRVASPFLRKPKKGKGNSIDIHNIGRPADNKAKKYSQAPPSEAQDMIDIPDLLRKESTTIIHGHGRAYDSVMANPSVFVDGNDLQSLRLELAKSPGENKGNTLRAAQQKFRDINQSGRSMPPKTFASVESPPLSPVESPKEKPRDEIALDRFSLGSSVKSGTLRVASKERDEYLQDLDDEPSLVPIDRTPALPSIKRKTSQKKTEEVMLPAVGEVPQRQAVSADAASLDVLRVASGAAPPQTRAVSADSFPIPLKKDMRTSANTSVSVQSDQGSGMTPVTMLHRDVSVAKTTLERNSKANKGMFSSFRSGASKRKKQKEKVLSSGEDPVNILASRNYQATIQKKKKPKPGKMQRNKPEDDSQVLMSPAYAKTIAREKKAKNRIKPMVLTPEDV